MAKCRWCKDTGEITVNFKTKPCTDCGCNHPSPNNDIGSPQDFPDESNLINGWYSSLMAAKQGVVVYIHAVIGEEVEITEISYSSTPQANPPDLKFVGVVGKYVRGSIH